MSIRLQAALFVIGLVALMVMAYSWIVSPSIVRTLGQEETDKIDQRAQVIAEQIGDTFTRAVQQLESAATLPGVVGMDRTQLDASLSQLDTTTPFFLFFMALDTNGTLVSRPSKPERVGASRGQRSYVSVPLATGQTHIQDIQISQAGHLTLVAGTPIRREGKVVGILAASLGLMDRNSRLYHAVALPVHASPMEVYLLAASGEVIATSTDLKFSVDDRLTRPTMASTPLQGTAEMTIEGRRWLVAASEIPALGWRAVVRVPRQVVDDKVDVIKDRFTLAGWISAAVILLIGLVIAEASARPLSRLTQALTRYGRDGTVEPVAIGGARELGDAMQAFNRMVHERERADEERERLKSQLQQSQKLQTIGTLTGGIAHDFNNFLTPVLLCGQSLVHMLPEDDPRRLMAESIVVSAEGARELANRLLNFSHTSEDRAPQDMAMVIKAALPLVKVSVPRSIALVIEIDEEAGWAVVDPIQIQQVLLNFTGNAIAAMRDRNGTLTIELRRGAEGEFVLLTVSDTGAGIDSEAVSRVFEPFYTTKPAGEGTGLGLAVVKGIVTDHKGRIEIESEPNHGTRFHVFLPRVGVGEEKHMNGPGEGAPPRGRVLVVDDDSFVARAMGLVLEDLGFEVVIERDPVAALKRFEEGVYTVDLILSDQNMPLLTGLGLARAVRKLHPTQEILIMTGDPDEALCQACEQLGLLPPLPKPFAPSDLKKALDSVLARAS